MDTLQQALVNEVKRHARANYDMSGWDVLVECYSDDDILDLIGRARTAKGAIRAAGQIMKRHNEQRSEAIAEAGQDDGAYEIPDGFGGYVRTAQSERADRILSHQMGECSCDGQVRCVIGRSFDGPPSFQKEVNAENGE